MPIRHGATPTLHFSDEVVPVAVTRRAGSGDHAGRCSDSRFLETSRTFQPLFRLHLCSRKNWLCSSRRLRRLENGKSFPDTAAQLWPVLTAFPDLQNQRTGANQPFFNLIELLGDESPSPNLEIKVILFSQSPAGCKT